MPYPIIEIHDRDEIEPLGTKEKFWFYEKGTGSRYLFKIGRVKTGKKKLRVNLQNYYVCHVWIMILRCGIKKKELLLQVLFQKMVD